MLQYVTTYLKSSNKYGHNVLQQEENNSLSTLCIHVVRVVSKTAMTSTKSIN
jgi:hypothetical protein